MKAINLFAPIVGNTGYAVHGINFAKALNQLTPICLIPKMGPLPNEDEVYEMVGRIADIDLSAISINLDFHQELYRFSGDIKIGYTVFETTVLPDSSLNLLKQLYQVWVPSQWAKQCLLNQGLQSEKVFVVPEGVDTQIYHPQGVTFDELTQSSAYKFLSVGKWESRKGLVELLHAFDKAFSLQDNVLLVLYLNQNIGGLSHISPAQEVDKLGLKNRNKILLIENQLQNPQQMSSLYRSVNAYVSASKAEGWGLPIIEAMACGLPAIVPNYSGPTEFANHQNCLLLPVTQFEEAYCPVFFSEKGMHGTWAKIDEDLLAEKMREMFLNQEQFKAMGLQAAKEMNDKFGWDKAAKCALEILRKL